MNAATLQPQLQQPYRRETWHALLPQLLPGIELFAQPHDFPLTSERERATATTRRQFGAATLADGKRVAFYEIEVAPDVQLLSNRVGLRSLIVKCIDEVSAHAVLAFFVQPGSRAYRLTYAAKESKLDEDLKIQTEQTAPRRYTYVLGPDESCRTAAERFAGLPAATGIADLTDAFSVEKLNKEFFTDFSAAFERVQAEIKKRNSWNERIAKEEAQTLLNRLLFLYFVQRKGWLNRQRDYLFRNFRQFKKEAPGKTAFLESFLRPLFVRLSTEGLQADIPGHDLPFLNGGLFSDEYGDEQHDETARRHHELKVSNEVFGHVFENLLERYNFTIQEDSPTNYEVAIDPEMLGQIFEELILTSEASETEGKSKRHDTGSVYTRRPIVHYLCRDSLTAWLESQPPFAGRDNAAARIKTLLELDATEGIDDDTRAKLNDCLTADEAAALHDLLFDLRACDPGVGSGAFPMGLLHELVNLARLCATRAAGTDPVLGDRSWLYSTKKRIIERVIYGVDIQPQAVDICKLRLWLSLMVDYELSADPDNCEAKSFRKALKEIEPLPNLDFKIRCANSLVDYIHGEPVELKRLSGETGAALPLSKLSSAKREFFNARTAAAKRKLRLDIYDALTELARIEFARARMEAAGLGMALDDESAERVVELDKGLKEIGFIAAQLRDARKMRAQEQEDALERIRARFDDPAKPTFIWQLDFAEVFHRTDHNTSGSLLRAESAVDSSASDARNGFDLLIGNPPYIRLQTLKKVAPHLVEYYKHRYQTARKGNFDLYVVFVERGMELLNASGQLAFILPHKFFNAEYGQSLRALISREEEDKKAYAKFRLTHLRQVVYFGDQQIFPGATNYVCLLFLAKAGATACRWVRADDLPAWLATQRGPETKLPAARITSAEWNFAVGSGAALFERLQRMPVKLGDAADIFVGLQTSADDVFIMNFVSETARTITLESKALEQNWTFEKDLLHPVVSGTDVSPFAALPSRQFILFPYAIENEQAELIPLKDLSDSWPRTAEYLKKNKCRLEDRENGKLSGTAKWHGYIYLKNMTRQNSPKLCVPRLVEYLHGGADFDGSHFLDNVDVGGVTFHDSATSHSLAYLLALLNSRLLRWFFPQVSAPFRGGFRSANKQFLSLVPFRPIDFEQPSEREAHAALVELAERILSAKRANSSADTTALEREINERVYRLYGLTEEEKKIVEDAAKQ